MTTNRIPAGLLDDSTEFFTVLDCDSQKLMSLSGGKPVNFSMVSDSIKSILSRAMKSQPAKEKAIEAMVGIDPVLKLEKFTMCNYGAINHEPDIDVNGNLSEPEYVPCPFRGKCVQEGKACGNIMVNGIMLSAAQTRVFKLSRLDNKSIADKLFISVETVKKHNQTIQDITGLAGKSEMVHWATIKGII